MCTHAGTGAGAARRAGWRIANGRSGGTRVLLQVQALLQQRLQLPAEPEPIKCAGESWQAVTQAG